MLSMNPAGAGEGTGPSSEATTAYSAVERQGGAIVVESVSRQLATKQVSSYTAAIVLQGSGMHSEPHAVLRPCMAHAQWLCMRALLCAFEPRPDAMCGAWRAQAQLVLWACACS